jgi:hypothetical protein
MQVAEEPETDLCLEVANRQDPAVLTIDGSLKRRSKPRGAPRPATPPGDGDRKRAPAEPGAAPASDRQEGSSTRPVDSEEAAEPGEEAEVQGGRRRADDLATRPDDEPGEATNGEVDEAAHERRPSAAAEPSDEEWLRSLPIRAALADPTEFDAEALLWRRLQPAVDQLLAVYQPSDSDLQKACDGADYPRRYRFHAAVLAGVNPPSQWEVCKHCEGASGDGPGRMTCSTCFSTGFLVTHRGETPFTRYERRRG